MGIVTAHAPHLIVITSILIAAIREFCIYAMDIILGFSKITTEDVAHESCNMCNMTELDDHDALRWEKFLCQYIIQTTHTSDTDSTGNGHASTPAKVVLMEMFEGEEVCKEASLASTKPSLLTPPRPLSGQRRHCHDLLPLAPSSRLLLAPHASSSEWQCQCPSAEPHQHLSPSSTLTMTISECAICLSEFEKGQTLRIMPNCGHAFHSDCILKWLTADFPESSHPDDLQVSSAIYDNIIHTHLHRSKTCPICRTSIFFTPWFN